MPRMKVSASIGVCALVLSVIASGQCAALLSLRQATPCGDPTDPSTPLGRCTIAGQTGDLTTVCNGCVSVFRSFYNCAGIDGDVQLNQLKSGCNSFLSSSTTTSNNAICTDMNPNSNLNMCGADLAAQNNAACSSSCRSTFENYISQCLGGAEAQALNDIITEQCGSSSGATTITPVVTFSAVIVAVAAAFN